MAGSACAVEADDGGLFDMGAGGAPPPAPGDDGEDDDGGDDGGDDGTDGSDGAGDADSSGGVDDTGGDDGTTGDDGGATDTGDDGGTTDGADTTTGGADTTDGADTTGGAGQSPQPSTGWYAHCLSVNDCDAGFGCLTNDTATDGFCSQLCTPTGDPSACAADPSGLLDTMCTVAGGGESVCALDCSAGDPCPTGMTCTADSQICM